MLNRDYTHWPLLAEGQSPDLPWLHRPFPLTCSLAGALGDKRTARPSASAEVRVQREAASLLGAEWENWTCRWRRSQTQQKINDLMLRYLKAAAIP